MELKPCPFCGNPAKIESFRMLTTTCFYVKCRCCDAEINNPVQNEKEALEAWNRRVKQGDSDGKDAAPELRGYWVEEPDRKNHWHCSRCHTVQGIACLAMNYCPHCGAEMVEHPQAASGCGQTFNPD